MIWLHLQLILGVLLLTKGADWFTRASAMITELTGLPRLLMGAILIGLATNLPEFAVSLFASWKGHGGVALANPIGSNICNTGLILGICLLQNRQKFELTDMRSHGAVMVLAALAAYLLILFGSITRMNALLLLGFCTLYVSWSFLSAKKDPTLMQELETISHDALFDNVDNIRFRWTAATLLAFFGCILVVVSSRWVLSSAVAIAQALDISESMIALTLIAAGTSLPELATVLSAAGKGHHDTSLGIVFGSNVYNLVGVIGISGLVNELQVSPANRFYDMPIMILFLVIPLFPCLWDQLPGRKTGIILVSGYFIYAYSLFALYGISES